QAARAVDRNKMTQARAQLTAAEKNVQANQQKVDELQKKLKDIEARVFREQQDANFAKATYDHDRYDFEATRAEKGDAAAQKKGQHVREQERQLSDLNLRLEKSLAERADLQKQPGQYTGQVAT